MSNNDKDLWFKTQDNKTKTEWLITPKRARELLGIPLLEGGLGKRIDYTQTRQEEITKILTEMLLPFFTKSALLDFVKENKDLNTRRLHSFLNKENQVLSRAFWYAKQELEKEGKIESVKQGRGKMRLWRLKP